MTFDTSAMSKMSIGAAIREVREAKKMTLQSLAAAASNDDEEIDAGNLSRFERDQQGIDLKKLERLAAALGTTMSELYQLAERGVRVSETVTDYNVSPGPEVFGSLPLISWVQAGGWNNVADPYEPGVAEKWIPVTRKYSRRAYCLRVRGDSMVAKDGPSFPEGCIICVEPELAATHKKLVIARLDDSQETTFKQLIIEGAEMYLRPLNAIYPMMHITQATTFCGVVRQMVLDIT